MKRMAWIIVGAVLVLIVIVAWSVIPGISLSVDQSLSSVDFIFSTHGINGILNVTVIRYDPGELLWKAKLNYFRGHRLRYGDVPGDSPMAAQVFPMADEAPKPLAPDSQFLVVIECQHDMPVPSVASFYFVLRTDKTGKVVAVKKMDRNTPHVHQLIKEHYQ